MVILIFFVIGQAVDLVIDYGHMTPIVDTHYDNHTLHVLLLLLAKYWQQWLSSPPTPSPQHPKPYGVPASNQ
jgi:hypothetical protein